MSDTLATLLRSQWREHPQWTFQLHYDNLAAVVRAEPELGTLPSYQTICRFMKTNGLRRQKRRRRRGSNEPLESREVRSYEVTHVHGLWHMDFHEGSRTVITPLCDNVTETAPPPPELL